MVSASFGYFKSPLGWRFDHIIRARRLEYGVYDSLTVLQRAAALVNNELLPAAFSTWVTGRYGFWETYLAINAGDQDIFNSAVM